MHNTILLVAPAEIKEVLQCLAETARDRWGEINVSAERDQGIAALEDAFCSSPHQRLGSFERPKYDQLTMWPHMRYYSGGVDILDVRRAASTLEKSLGLKNSCYPLLPDHAPCNKGVAIWGAEMDLSELLSHEGHATRLDPVSPKHGI